MHSMSSLVFHTCLSYSPPPSFNSLLSNASPVSSYFQNNIPSFPCFIYPSTGIDSCPTLEHMSKFIVCEVAADWEQMATFLGIWPFVIDNVEHHHCQCEQACTYIFEQWLSWTPGTGKKERTCRTVLSAVKKVRHKVLSQRLQTEVFHFQ